MAGAPLIWSKSLTETLSHMSATPPSQATPRAPLGHGQVQIRAKQPHNSALKDSNFGIFDLGMTQTHPVPNQAIHRSAVSLTEWSQPHVDIF